MARLACRPIERRTPVRRARRRDQSSERAGLDRQAPLTASALASIRDRATAQRVAGCDRGRTLRAFAAALAAAWLAGCASFQPAPAESDAAARCTDVYRAVDAAVAAAGVPDARAARIDGFPYLRVDRFLASFRWELGDEALPAWTDAMLALDRHARTAELANLPSASRAALRADLRAAGVPDEPPAALLEGCGRTLQRAMLANPEARARLRSAAVVPDDYDTWKRVVGLYALTSIPFSAGVTAYQREVQARFEIPVAELPTLGGRVRYVPAGDVAAAAQSPAAVRAVLERAPFAPPAASDLEPLLAAYAPILVVDTVDDDDRLGAPALDPEGRRIVATGKPVAYARVAYTRYRDATLVQFVYSFWFPARPKAGAFDLLGGAVDGITWRVTFAPDGQPVLFDTMHNCGCYHMFFPTPRAAPLPPAPGLDEGALIPERLPVTAAGARPTLRVAARTHYVQRVTFDDASAAASFGYSIASDDLLRSLALPGGGRASFFAADGIVPGSERGERYLFWPMGVRDPGAMREWGRHATAFVGRRHFDDARLVERYFVLRAGGAQE